MRKISYLSFILLFVFCPFTTLVQAQGGKGYGPEFRSLGEQITQAVAEGDLAKAENLARRRIEIALFTGRSVWVGNAYRNLGNVLRQQGKLPEAEVMLQKAQPLIEASNGRLSYQAIRNLMSYTRLLIAEGRYAEATNTARDVINRQKAYAPDRPDIVHAYNLAASIEKSLGHSKEALNFLDAADSLKVIAESARDDDGDTLSTEFSLQRWRGESAYLRALVELRRAKFKEAEAQNQRAIGIYRANGQEQHPDMVRAKSQLGNILLQLNRPQEAESILSEAYQLNERHHGANHSATLYSGINLAIAQERNGKLKEAEAQYKRVVSRSERSLDLELLAFASRSQGSFFIRINKLPEALNNYQRSLDAVDRLFTQTRGLDEATRSGFIQRFGRYYIETLRLLLALHKEKPNGGYDREALAVISRTQSRVFTELLRHADVGLLSSDARFQGLRKEETALKQRLIEAQRARTVAGHLKEEGDDEKGNEEKQLVQSAAPIVVKRQAEHLARLDAELKSAQTALSKVEAALLKDYPRYAEMTQPQPVTVDLLQKRILKPDETLLTYFLLPDRVLAFLVENKRFRLVQIPVRQEQINQWVATARTPMSAGEGEAVTLAKLDPEVLFKLYDSLFRPIKNELKEGQRLLVVGDGSLHSLPLEMLVTRWGIPELQAFTATRKQGEQEKLDLAEYAGLDYLGKHYQFSYLPSLSALVSVRMYRKPAVQFQRNLVSFADPMFEKGAENKDNAPSLRAIARTLNRNGSMNIPRLPETALEAQDIARILGGDTQVFLREKAQEHTVKSMDLRATRYLHFATHGLLGGEFVQIQHSLGLENKDEAQRNLVSMANAALTPENPEEWVGDSKRGEPALLLSLSGDMRGDDGLLTVREVVESLDLSAQLVVLSACNTAGENASTNNGEGFAGLTRAFMYAGAKGLVVSHWSVESQSAQELMTDLFRHLKAGTENSSAVEMARTTIRNSTVSQEDRKISRAHPYYWAPFVYVGD